MMKLRPFHDHPLVQDYSEWIGADYYFAPWFCPTCKLAFDGPPYVLGEYVIDREMIPPTRAPWLHKRVWRVHMKSNFARGANAPLFETPRRIDALKHARQAERERQHILRAAAGDPLAVAENYKIVERLRRKEQGS